MDSTHAAAAQQWKRREKKYLCYTLIHDLSDVQIKLILLNPRSHSAVLTGSVWIALISLLNIFHEAAAPFTF